MSPAVARMRKAMRSLSQGNPEEVLKILPDELEASPAGESIRLTARGLILEREGKGAEADRCFHQAIAQGAPVRPVLRECGRYFKRTGQYAQAYQCYSILQNFAPEVISNEFVKGLPEPELARYAPWLVRRHLSRPHGGLYALQPVKAALVSQFGPEPAAMTFAHIAGLRGQWDATRMSISPLLDYAREHAVSYDELYPSREIEMPATPIFGRPAGALHQARTRTFFVCVVANAIVSWKSNLVLTDDRALLDHQADELEKVPRNLEVDPILFAPDGGKVTVLTNRRAATRAGLERAFSLVGLSSTAFGHWILDFLPKVWACIGRPGFDSVPILIDDQMPRQHREALEFFVGHQHPIVVIRLGEVVHVDELWLCSTLSDVGVPPMPVVAYDWDPMVLDDKALAELLAKVRPMFEVIAPMGPKRLYLTRRDTQKRKLVNREEVEGWFADHDFEIVDFAELSFRDQIGLVRGADVIVGPDGSALLMSLFARAGTRLGVLTNPYALDNEWYALICDRLDHPLSILTGELTRKSPTFATFSGYRIDLDGLPPFIDQLVTRR